jgi:hygromycin-B 7''-O-kinase
MRLPEQITPAQFRAEFQSQPERWREVALDIAQRHGVKADDFHPYSDGVNLVAALSNRVVIKVFPPYHKYQWDSERVVLAYLAGKRFSVPVPALMAEGEWPENWTYLVMEKLQGQPLETVWIDLPESQRVSLLEKIGALMAEVHKISLSASLPLEPNWKHFLERQLEGVVARHTRLAMPQWFLGTCEGFVKRESTAFLRQSASVLLTGEYTPFNILASGSSSACYLTGMIDFADGMFGPLEYDFLGPSMFLAEGRTERIQALFRGYGYDNDQLTPAFRRQLMCLQILHRYSNFSAQCRIPDWKTRSSSIETLAELIWPFGGV